MPPRTDLSAAALLVFEDYGKERGLTPAPITEYERYIQKKQRLRRMRRRRITMLIVIIAVIVAVLFLLIKLACSLFGGRSDKKPEEPPIEQTDTYVPEQTAEISDAEKLQYIYDNPELYTESLISFVEHYPQTLDYVYDYPEKKAADREIDLTAEAAQSDVPQLLQWDERWGYKSYAGGLIGYSGCGPVCMSMVTLYLTENAKFTPVYLASLAEENGYTVEGDGTSWDLMRLGSEDVGLSSAEIPLDENLMVAMLRSGAPIICAVGPGDFTYAGHYIVIRGYENGEFVVNDPNNPENSKKTWSYERIRDQISNIWAFWGERLDDMALTVISDDINVRSAPSFEGKSVGKMNPGDTFTIDRIEAHEGCIWGRMANDRWISMAYVKTA